MIESTLAVELQSKDMATYVRFTRLIVKKEKFCDALTRRMQEVKTWRGIIGIFPLRLMLLQPPLSVSVLH